jgi:molybdopterin/thiamine biosynthesis adenylyltransferase/rhodanese-related sulfurtransferase
VSGPPPTVREVRAPEAIELARDGYRVIDVREPAEWQAGHVDGATLIPVSEVAARFETEVPDRDSPVLLHCRSGARSGRVAAYLAQRGYTNLVNLVDLIDAWPRLGGPWVEPREELSAAQQHRYSRQVLIPEIGPAGQRRLLDGSVLLVGAGGLGSPVALYLAAAGVGTIGIVDDDSVEESNLQRQVLHTTARIGQPKTASARASLEALNPDTRVVEHTERLTPDNVERLIAGYDVIVDGTDNFDARYALNDAAVRLRKPVVHGSIYRWDGQVTTFVPFKGPCYRCMHPTRPPAELAPDCAVAGVLGVLPGMAGMLQANEAFKLLLGVGETLVGRLLMFDARTSEFSEVQLRRDPACPACGTRSSDRAASTAAALTS